jgi:ribosomal protein L7/L12
VNAHLSDGDREEILGTLCRRGKVAALSLLRQKTGMEIKEAMETIDSLAQASAPARPLDGSESTGQDRPRDAESLIPLTDEDRAELREVLLRRGKVAALSLLRQKTGVNLTTAEETVRSLLEAQESAVPPTELLDLAVDFVIGPRRLDRAGKSEDFDELAGRWDRAQRDEALKRAQALYERAVALCDRRRGYRSFLAESRAMCPGFGDESYHKTWGRAMVDTR